MCSRRFFGQLVAKTCTFRHYFDASWLFDCVASSVLFSDLAMQDGFCFVCRGVLQVGGLGGDAVSAVSQNPALDGWGWLRSCGGVAAASRVFPSQNYALENAQSSKWKENRERAERQGGGERRSRVFGRVFRVRRRVFSAAHRPCTAQRRASVVCREACVSDAVDQRVYCGHFKRATAAFAANGNVSSEIAIVSRLSLQSLLPREQHCEN